MNILIYGTGGVGGYFGGKLAEAFQKNPGTNHLTFIARGEHGESIQRNGLVLKTDAGEITARPDLITSDPRTAPVPDLILLCVKVYDLPDAARVMDEIIKPDTVIIPLLNGVDSVARIRKITSRGIVLPACEQNHGVAIASARLGGV